MTAATVSTPMKDNENKIHLFMHPRTKERLFRPNETVWLEYLVKTFSPRIQSIILLLYILFILHPESEISNCDADFKLDDF